MRLAGMVGAKSERSSFLFCRGGGGGEVPIVGRDTETRAREAGTEPLFFGAVVI